MGSKGLTAKYCSLLALAGYGVVMAGCGGDARIELVAADTLQAVAERFEKTVSEYHEEVGRLDASRESAVIAAFVARTRKDANDASAMERHAADFREALNRIRTDREVERQRCHAAMDNAAVLREVASGLQRLAIESLTLEDEMRRYLESWLEARRRASEPTETQMEGGTHG